MTHLNSAKRLRLAAAALVASLLIGPAAFPAATLADPPAAVVAGDDLEASDPLGFEIDGQPEVAGATQI